ncbi:MAG: SdiA-regulated domain-containing protein [Ferruginibacter sp.]
MALLKNAFSLFVIIAFEFALYGCNIFGGKDRFADSEMYDFSKPRVINLPEALDEISGIAYYPKDTSVFAIVDEDGMLYKIPIMHPTATRQWRFDKRRDYEDIVLHDSTFYVLVSNGDIETIHFRGDSVVSEKADFSTRSKKANEFESLYYNNDSSKLIIVCKECEDDTKKTFSLFSYNIHGTNDYAPYMTIDAVPIAQKMGVEKMHIKASAAAINPVTEDLYILSSINHIMIVLSQKGLFRQLYKLDPGIYKQAEGLAFTPQGDMIISNEYAETGFATLLILKNKLKGR